MCSVSVLCPVCFKSSFMNIDSLRVSLIKAANGPLQCPICQDLLLGLDKLTIHLFSHSNSMTHDNKNMTTDVQTSISHVPVLSGVSNAFEMTAESKNCIALSQVLQVPNQRKEVINVKKNSATNGTKLLKSERNNQCMNTSARISPSNSTIQGNIFKCHICSKTFKMNGLLRLHLKVVHFFGLSLVNKVTKVNMTSKISSNNGNMTLLRNDISQTDNISIEEESNTLPQIIEIAQLTEKNNKIMSDLQEKLSISKVPHKQNGISNENILENTKRAEMGNLIAVQTDNKANETAKIWKCDFCSKSFTTKYFLKKHKRLHTGEMPYTCEICARTFTFQQSYHKHLLYHSNEKPHVCQTCGRAFKELSTLHNHERIHSGEKPFSCEVCGKSFRQRVSFLVHTRIHTGVMPYKCETCQKCFRYKVSQRTHKCLPIISESSQELTALFSENLISFFENTSLLQEQSSFALTRSEYKNNSAYEEKNFDTKEEMLSKAIDDIVVESCQKLGIGNSSPTKEPHDSSASMSNVQIQSPTNKFQVMHIYSDLSDQIEDLNGISFSQYLSNN